jgi:rhamnulokinase
MDLPASKSSFVAVDLGAQSCRVSLLTWNHGAPHIAVIHRFPNAPIATATGLRWDLKAIFEGVKEGLRLCAEAAPEGIESIGVDGWAVDYARLDGNGKLLENPFCYRDERTAKATAEVHRLISPEKLYSLTGIQLLSLNTLYQLYADKLAGFDPHSPWVNIPEYVTHLLGGKRVSEYTNATHTQLVALGTEEWCDEIFKATGLDKSAAPNIVSTGTIVGDLGEPLRSLPALRRARLIVPACHDTTSAVAAVPATGDDWAFISSGTWSLVGTVLDSPCVTDEARKMNFTNLGGVGGTICFLKNVNGMWLLRQCMDEWEAGGHIWSLEDLVQQCEPLPEPRAFIDVDEPQLMLPGNMLAKINGQLERAGHQGFAADSHGIPMLANTVFHSLARRYAEVLATVGKITKKKLQRLFIVGGGSKNGLLNRLTAQYTGLEVVAGSSECSTIGNFAIQIAALQNERNSPRSVAAPLVAQFAQALTLDSVPFSLR